MNFVMLSKKTIIPKASLSLDCPKIRSALFLSKFSLKKLKCHLLKCFNLFSLYLKCVGSKASIIVQFEKVDRSGTSETVDGK